MRANNAAVKAMFESAGPKYRFGGSGGGGGGGALSSRSEADLRSRKRPSLRPREERRWVLDSINKHFDVIVEVAAARCGVANRPPAGT